MEKINTPLGELKEDLLKQSKGWDRTVPFDHGYLCGIEYVLDTLKRLQPKERDTMVDFAQAYKSHCFQSIEFPDSARKMFNETFKSYE